MRQFRIEPEVFSILPHLEIGAVALRGIDNRTGGGDSAAVLQAACARLRERLTAHGGELPEIQDYVEAMKLFRRIAENGCAVVMSTHNTALIENYPARAVLFAQGKIREVDLAAELA